MKKNLRALKPFINSTRRTALIFSLSMISICLLVPISANAYEKSCWGQASAVFAQMGEMGEHASQQETPRLGLRNLARALYEAGVISDDSMEALGMFVAGELGLSIDACNGVSILGLQQEVASGVQGAFVHGPVINVDGEDYYFAGAPDGPDGETDIPGHYWVQAGPNQVVGKHFNTGPFGALQWWSSDAPDGELLYIVHGIIDVWSEEIAATYAAKGYIHYHELVLAEDGELHPTKVAWLKHIARTSFNLDGGPHPEFTHDVSPGADYEFIPNGMIPYP